MWEHMKKPEKGVHEKWKKETLKETGPKDAQDMKVEGG